MSASTIGVNLHCCTTASTWCSSRRCRVCPKPFMVLFSFPFFFFTSTWWEVLISLKAFLCRSFAKLRASYLCCKIRITSSTLATGFNIKGYFNWHIQKKGQLPSQWEYIVFGAHTCAVSSAALVSPSVWNTTNSLEKSKAYYRLQSNGYVEVHLPFAESLQSEQWLGFDKAICFSRCSSNKCHIVTRCLTVDAWWMLHPMVHCVGFNIASEWSPNVYPPLWILVVIFPENDLVFPPITTLQLALKWLSTLVN